MVLICRLVGIVVRMIEYWAGRLDSWLVGKLVVRLVAGIAGLVVGSWLTVRWLLA